MIQLICKAQEAEVILKSKEKEHHIINIINNNNNIQQHKPQAQERK